MDKIGKFLHDLLVRLNPLDAPKDYNWTDDDVQYEKVDSYISGWIAGIVVINILWLICVLVAT